MTDVSPFEQRRGVVPNVSTTFLWYIIHFKPIEVVGLMQNYMKLRYFVLHGGSTGHD